MLDSREGQYYDYLVEQNIPILDSGLKGRGDFNIKIYRSLQRQFSLFHIIHLHNFSPLRSIASQKFKTVYTIHGLSKGIRKESFGKKCLREGLKKYFLKRMNIIVANSQYTKEEAIKDYNLEQDACKVVLNGVNLPQLVQQEEENNLDDFTIGLVSRFTSRKRIDRLVTAFYSFLKKGGVGKLIMVGDGDTFKEIEQMVQNKFLEDHVELVGYSNNVQDYYEKFDICVFPAEEEPFGLVGVEAYFYGKPVLAFSDSGGLKEVIEPLEPENIVDTVENLAERLLQLQERKFFIKNEAGKRQEYARKHFSVERMERNYFKIYKSLGKDV